LLLAALVFTLVASCAVGAFYFAPLRMFHFLEEPFGLRSAPLADVLDRNVFLTLRLPRVLLCGFTGAALGVSGTLMQGLFRNPIVEPGLAGTSAGAALGAALVFVFGNTAADFTAPLGAAAVPIMAFLGAFAATMLVYRISTLFGRTDVLTLLLAGIAVNAVCNAGTGLLSYVAHDPQARNITFWNLGTFTTANWHDSALVAAVFLFCFAFIGRYGKVLNALMLGEDDAAFLGIDLDRVIWRLLLVNTLLVAVTTAMVGVIAFVGLVVPHVLRLLKSSDYTFLIPASALFGAILMEWVDVAARLIIRPAELPVGILTAMVGAPIFLFILLGQRRVRVQRDA
jgi:iron complex transport system permease protein